MYLAGRAGIEVGCTSSEEEAENRKNMEEAHTENQVGRRTKKKSEE